MVPAIQKIVYFYNCFPPAWLEPVPSQYGDQLVKYEVCVITFKAFASLFHWYAIKHLLKKLVRMCPALALISFLDVLLHDLLAGLFVGRAFSVPRFCAVSPYTGR